MRRVPDEPDVAKRIAGWRHLKRLSQVVVARRAKIAPSYLSRIEGGKVHPTVRTAMRIATALRMSPSDLLGHSPSARKGHRCAITVSGPCLMDLIDTGHGSSRTRDPERYTPQQLRLLRRFSGLVQQVNPGMLQTLEVLLDKMLEDGALKRK